MARTLSGITASPDSLYIDRVMLWGTRAERIPTPSHLFPSFPPSLSISLHPFPPRFRSLCAVFFCSLTLSYPHLVLPECGSFREESTKKLPVLGRRGADGERTSTEGHVRRMLTSNSRSLVSSCVAYRTGRRPRQGKIDHMSERRSQCALGEGTRRRIYYIYI